MSLPLVAATCLLAGSCAALLTTAGPDRHLHVRLPELSPGGGSSWRSALPRVQPLGAACVAVVSALLLWRPSALLLLLTLALVVSAVLWLHTTARARRQADRARRTVVEACDALTAELRAGQPASTAAKRVAQQHPALAPVHHACTLGGDVPAAWRQLARLPGYDGLRAVAAAWQVAECSGAGLTDAVGRVAESLRGEQSVRAEVEAALAPARATARMLAVLPAVGLTLGSGLGGDPLDLLLTTTVGNLLVFVGAALAIAGMVWVERLALAVESCR